MKDEWKTKNQKMREIKGKMINPLVQHLAYSYAPTKKDKERQYARFQDIFKRLQINTPFSKALEQKSTYAKFMKENLQRKGGTQMTKQFI